MSDAQVRDEVMTLFIAGHETGNHVVIPPAPVELDEPKLTHPNIVGAHLAGADFTDAAWPPAQDDEPPPSQAESRR